MNVVVIKLKSNNQVVAVVEQTAGFSAAAVALIWARANGHPNFPTDLIVESGVQVVPLASVLKSVMPCHEIEQIEKEAN